MINWSRVEELRDDFGEDGFAEVIEVFLEEVVTGQDRLAAATTPEAMRAEFHFLKGAALNMGLEEIAAICSRGEVLSEQGHWAQAERDTLLELLPKDCAEFSRDWRSKLGMEV
ncbi:MAG: Hpt domain-containing protein [Rhodobacteraceae bacterium]|nr:MAG: Hpt domain-containing protein [Paracoccaceae bacterium]